MTDLPYATRRELDLLKAAADAEHAQFRSDLHALDTGGSRGVVGLQVQMTDAAKDLAKLSLSIDILKRDMDTRFDAHVRVHAEEARTRVSSRRWIAGLVVAGVAAVDGPLVTILLARR